MSMADELADTHAAESADVGAVDSGVIGQEVPERAEKAPTLRETLNNSIKEVADKEARARDDKGKFATKPLEAPEKAAAAEIPSEKRDVPPTKTSGIPPGFSAETKAFLDTLPQDHPIKRDLEKRETEISNGFKTYSDKAKSYDAIDQVIAPSRATFQQAGLKSDAEAINRLFQWEAFVRSNPTRALAQLARQYGVDLSQLAQGSTQAPSGQEVPEYIRPVLDQFGQMTQTVQSIQTEIQNSRMEKVSSELATFAKDKPHFEKVRVAMGQLMQAGMVQPGDLDGAYQRAIWADPELRETLLREQDEKRKAEFQKTAAEQAKNARLAAVSPAPRARQGAPVANGHDKGAKGVRGSLLASIKELEENQRA